MKKLILLYFALLSGIIQVDAQSHTELIAKGWSELIKDNDTTALHYFNESFLLAQKNNDKEAEATALLHLGIASYGSSLSNGLNFCTKALQTYALCEKTNPTFGQSGRSKCLILTATIKARSSKENEAILLCNEAVKISSELNDTSSSLGLAYNLLGSLYAKKLMNDSADYYFNKALYIRLKQKEFTYLPGAFTKVGDIELRKKRFSESFNYYQKALHIADSMHNRQAKIMSLISLSKWELTSSNNYTNAEKILLEAKQIANSISDKSFYISVLKNLKNLKKEENKYAEALALEEEIVTLSAAVNDLEKAHITKSLEVQFGLIEKERELNLIKKEQSITKLTNYLLFAALAFISLLALGFILFLKRINKRDKQLLEAKAELMEVFNEQKKLKEQQLQNEIEFKESQLSAMTFQMIQKNELMQELKEKLEHKVDPALDASVNKIINKGLTQDKEWVDFNSHFESINKNFYARIKSAFPEISPNELKICALIKMNLSIKEMASILNISPDSVKTARYRLRKKLNLNTEDNLTNFILNLQ